MYMKHNPGILVIPASEARRESLLQYDSGQAGMTIMEKELKQKYF